MAGRNLDRTRERIASGDIQVPMHEQAFTVHNRSASTQSNQNLRPRTPASNLQTPSASPQARKIQSPSYDLALQELYAVSQRERTHYLSQIERLEEENGKQRKIIRYYEERLNLDKSFAAPNSPAVYGDVTRQINSGLRSIVLDVPSTFEVNSRQTVANSRNSGSDLPFRSSGPPIASNTEIALRLENRRLRGSLRNYGHSFGSDESIRDA